LPWRAAISGSRVVCVKVRQGTGFAIQLVGQYLQKCARPAPSVEFFSAMTARWKRVSKVFNARAICQSTLSCERGARASRFPFAIVTWFARFADAQFEITFFAQGVHVREQQPSPHDLREQVPLTY